MLITNKTELLKYTEPHRIWQGIPSIAVTENGRIFSAFFSGGVAEENGNFVVLQRSDDGASSFEMVAVVKNDDGRCFDESLWIDPLGRLWLFWAEFSPEEGVHAVVCDDPDAKELSFGEEIFVGRTVMINKPTVLSDGEWLLPITVWEDRFRSRSIWPLYLSEPEESGAFAYSSRDDGKTFVKKGKVCAPQRHFDEHCFLELLDGRIMMLIRTFYGIAVSYSSDKGVSWSEAVDSGLGGPCSRFFITRLRSGNVLLINHYEFIGRNNLTALLSDDDCKSWKYKLLLDSRDNVAYPNAQQTSDGYIHIIYDRERGCFKKSLEEAYADAREILYAKITEEDIMAGELVNKKSELRRVISALSEYEDGDAPYMFERFWKSVK